MFQKGPRVVKALQGSRMLQKIPKAVRRFRFQDRECSRSGQVRSKPEGAFEWSGKEQGGSRPETSNVPERFE
jgi:hypothetical protein